LPGKALIAEIGVSLSDYGFRPCKAIPQPIETPFEPRNASESPAPDDGANLFVRLSSCGFDEFSSVLASPLNRVNVSLVADQSQSRLASTEKSHASFRNVVRCRPFPIARLGAES
jgi:hypothetical protein